MVTLYFYGIDYLLLLVPGGKRKVVKAFERDDGRDSDRGKYGDTALSLLAGSVNSAYTQQCMGSGCTYKHILHN